MRLKTIPSWIKILTVLAIIMTFSINSEVFAQTEIEQKDPIILTGDKLNDPIAQDILKKIEQTKKWIIELEEREYEKMQVQNQLDAIRATALERLNQDLLEWEKLWEEYSSRNAFEKFVDKKPDFVQGVFWDQFEFKEMKVNAGRAALKKVLENGGTLRDAREAYHLAAETKRIELIEQNANFNVKHNLAYYKEQILFNYEGKFINSTESLARLNSMYNDYIQNSAYLEANAQDYYAYHIAKTEAETICRQGFVNVHRIVQDDFTCITESTALNWITYGIAELPNTPKKIHTKEISADIDLINQQIREINEELEIKQIQLKKSYDLKYYKIEKLSKNEEKTIIAMFTVAKSISEEKFTEKMLETRHKLNDDKEDMLKQKLKDLQELLYVHQTNIDEIFIEFKDSLDVKLIWNSDEATYQAVKK